MENISGRKLRVKLISLLQEPDLGRSMEAIGSYEPRRLIGPLFSFLYQTDPLIRWRSITAMGMVVARMADQQMESARVVMRRLIWNMNDESGGIGWGSPEAMGEIMARHLQLAVEYGRLMESYIRKDGNDLEYPDLQAGVLWGIGRLAHARPYILCGAALHLSRFLTEGTPILKGLAAWITQALFNESLRDVLMFLVKDETPLCLYRDGTFLDTTVGRLAETSLERHQREV